MHGFILSAAVAGEGFVRRFRLFAAFSHLSRAAKKQEGEAGEAGAETQGKAEYAGARGSVKKAKRSRAPRELRGRLAREADQAMQCSAARSDAPSSVAEDGVRVQGDRLGHGDRVHVEFRRLRPGLAFTSC